MLYHTLQHLCFTGALEVQFKEVTVGGRRGRTLNRLFLSRGHRPDDRSGAFAWELLPADAPCSLVDLRLAIEERIEDHEAFKYELMWPDLTDAGLLRGHHTRTPQGRSAWRRVRAAVHRGTGYRPEACRRMGAIDATRPAAGQLHHLAE